MLPPYLTPFGETSPLQALLQRSTLLVSPRWHTLSVQCIPNLYTREFYFLVPPCYLAVSPSRCPASSIKRPPQAHLGRVGNSRTNPSPNSRSHLQSSSTHLVGSRKNAYGSPPTKIHRQDNYSLNPATATNRDTICQESRIPSINGWAHQNQILRFEGLIFESVTLTGKTIALCEIHHEVSHTSNTSPSGIITLASYYSRLSMTSPSASTRLGTYERSCSTSSVWQRCPERVPIYHRQFSQDSGYFNAQGTSFSHVDLHRLFIHRALLESFTWAHSSWQARSGRCRIAIRIPLCRMSVGLSHTTHSQHSPTRQLGGAHHCGRDLRASPLPLYNRPPSLQKTFSFHIYRTFVYSNSRSSFSPPVDL